MEEKFKSFLLKASSKKTGGLVSSFDKYLETFKVPMSQALKQALMMKMTMVSCNSEKLRKMKRTDAVYFHLTFLVFKT